MPILRAEKERLIEELTQELQNGRLLYVFKYTKLNSKANDEIRTKIFELGGKIKMISNNMLRILLKGLDKELEMPEAPLAMAYGFADEVTAAKALADFAKTTDTIEMIGGWIDDKFYDQTSMKSLAQLPGREQLHAQVVGRLAGMLQALVYNLSYPRNQLIYALKDLESKKGKNNE